jgi:alkylated DNA nucleotide flippase Atl1
VVVTALFVKPRAGAPMVRVAELAGARGRGLADDANASASSPRHVLLASAGDLRALALPDDALRANVVVDGSLDGVASGDVLHVGSLALRITIRCDTCRRLDDERRGLAAQVGARRGVLARVICDGRATVGAPVERGGQLPALAASWHDRVRAIVRAIPRGHVMTYTGLARAAGVQSVYCRALPAVLRKVAAPDVPVDRVVPGHARRDAVEWDASAFYAADE